MMALYLHKSDHVANSPVTALVHEGINDMIQEGMASEYGLCFPVDPSDAVFYGVSDDGDPVGVICVRKHGPTWEVRLAYVEPSSRRAKVMTRLWKEMVGQAKAEKVQEVIVSVACENKVGTALAKKLGGMFDTVKYAIPV